MVWLGRLLDIEKALAEQPKKIAEYRVRKDVLQPSLYLPECMYHLLLVRNAAVCQKAEGCTCLTANTTAAQGSGL